MRHFLRARLAPRPEVTLALGMIAPPLAAGLVLAPCCSQAPPPRLYRARRGAVPISAVAGSAQQERLAAQQTSTSQQVHATTRAAVDLRAGTCESIGCVGSTGLWSIHRKARSTTSGPSSMRRWRRSYANLSLSASPPATEARASGRRASPGCAPGWPTQVEASAYQRLEPSESGIVDPGEVTRPAYPALAMVALPRFPTVVSKDIRHRPSMDIDERGAGD